MTHGHVSTSQTLIYPCYPLSQSIFVFQKQQKKTAKAKWKPWVGTTTKPAGRAMQTTHEVGQKWKEKKPTKGEWTVLIS